jgi:hypothetical protein
VKVNCTTTRKPPNTSAAILSPLEPVNFMPGCYHAATGRLHA